MATPEQSFILGVSGATGIDPRVLAAEIQAEGHPGDEPGYFNWLNIPTSTASYNVSKYGAPGAVSTGPGGTAAFGSLPAGVKATVTEEYAIGLGQERGKTVAQQISDIQHSGWASSGYPDLPGLFISSYGQAAYASAAQPPPANPNDIGSATILPAGASKSQASSIAGALVNTGLGLATLIPGVNAGSIGLNSPTAPQVSGLNALINAASGTWKAILQFVKLYYLRVLEVIGGAILVVVSLFMLTRGAVPSPL